MDGAALLALFSASVSQPLWSDKERTATTGSAITINCFYDPTRYLYYTKYWCFGDSRNHCTILGDTKGCVESQYKDRLTITQIRFGVYSVTMTKLTLEDAGTYWCGIDAPYADVLFQVKLTVIEEPVSAPEIKFIDDPTKSCSGRPVTLNCFSHKGFDIRYSWYRKTDLEDLSLGHSANLVLHCGLLPGTQEFYCKASNRASRQSSWVVKAVVLTASTENCVYQLLLNEQGKYTCGTSTLPPTTTERASSNVDLSSEPATGEQTLSYSPAVGAGYVVALMCWQPRPTSAFLQDPHQVLHLP
ncbi:polymeric immunoglobulin receptor-like [Rhinatrema bivittatum]|uniref:polymeric immunoglobulin receptor-like n=1 Tax=Rhinatrema bivittatum TaxID=194408 RepID=UPI001129206A|nr:polymeric immunoglobulin receptor-like [Rhinatrema bivittatum]